jgi:hypothetical protein
MSKVVSRLLAYGASVEENLAQQQSAFAELLASLGQASDEEIQQALTEEREAVEPEAGLNSEIISRFRNRLAKSESPA